MSAMRASRLLALFAPPSRRKHCANRPSMANTVSRFCEVREKIKSVVSSSK